MELRYQGFDQAENARVYRFDLVIKDRVTTRLVVTADLALFRTYHVAIQEGPSLCAQKLAADLQVSPEGTHELTIDDLRAYADARAAEEARKLQARKSGPRRPKPPAAPFQSPWRTTQG
jgi:hypothetical protein